MMIDEAIKDNCDGKCTNCNNTELQNIKDCKEIDIGYSYAYKTDCVGDRYIKAEEVKYLLKCERNKAIDDFSEKLKEMANSSSTNYIRIADYSSNSTNICCYSINEIAEQLKAGGKE